MPGSGHTLTIVIPALDEEEAIGETVSRCLAARAHIIETSSVTEVEIIVVSDGSTDGTEAIAREFTEISVLVFEENRGYGAAIQCGFDHGHGDLVAFMDADGTCDPAFFADLCRELDAQQADLALGSRMGPDSKMPLVRTIGNLVFAWILGLLSGRQVKDTASGMRVIRKSALPDLYPLPDGLHFTPAMSARVLLEDRLELIELPMPYAERQGESKLSVMKDGARFLRCILQAAVTFQPARPLLFLVGLCAIGAVVFASQPALYWFRHHELLETMIYRILIASLLVTVGAIMCCAAVVADRIAATAYGRPITTSGLMRWIVPVFSIRGRRIGGLLLVALAFVLVWPGLTEWWDSRQVYMHWSRAALSSLLLVLAAMLGVTTFLLNMLELIQANRENDPRVRPPERVYEAREPVA